MSLYDTLHTILTGDPSDLIAILQSHGYLILFILMFLEGPIVTIAAAFAASYGIFNIYYVYILSVLGNIVPDILYFLLGRYSRIKSVEVFLARTFLSKVRLKKFEHGLRKNTIKSIIIIKLTPYIPLPGIILAGFLKVPMKKFVITSTVINFIISLLFVFVGFYSGLAIKNIVSYFKLGEYFLLLVLVVAVLLYSSMKKVSSTIKDTKRI